MDENIPEPLSEDEFFEALKGNRESEKKDLKETLERAYDIRKFEIDLYWKRATYFWAFIAAIFAAYFIGTVKLTPHNKFLVTCVGFVFSIAWYLVNRGSYYWTTHWERIIDAIETRLGINLYKLNLQEKENPRLDDYHPHSVSRINIIVSLFICAVWLGLIVNFLFENISDYCNSKKIKCPIHDIDWKIIFILFITCVATYWLLYKTKSRKGEKGGFHFYKRDSEYDKKIRSK